MRNILARNLFRHIIYPLPPPLIAATSGFRAEGLISFGCHADEFAKIHLQITYRAYCIRHRYNKHQLDAFIEDIEHDITYYLVDNVWKEGLMWIITC